MEKNCDLDLTWIRSDFQLLFRIANDEGCGGDHRQKSADCESGLGRKGGRDR